MAGQQQEHGHDVEHATDGHRHEQPEDWGWHGEWGKYARIMGWISIVLLFLANITTHYNRSQDPWLYGIAALLLLILVRDHYRRKNSWRS